MAGMSKSRRAHNQRSRPPDLPPGQRPESHDAGATSDIGWRALLLIISGTAALIYQVLWIKQLSLIVGVDVYAVTAGISAFFAGLALGGLVLGRWADRVARPLRLYAALEIGVALIGVAVTIALVHSAVFFATLESKSGVFAWAPVFLLVGAGPFLMGGTLPAIVRSLGLTADRIGAGGGWMYSGNTAGAIFGALANHVWSVGGDNSRRDISSTFVQPFLTYTTPGATTFGLNTESTYD